MEPNHVFIHSIWRTSSTYIWHTFRRLDQVKGFYEPFHPCLRAMTPASSQGQNQTSLGHSLGTPYWLEYKEVATEEGGVPHFSRAFSIKKYVPKQNGLSIQERDYIAVLLENAESHQKQACLGFVRSCMRAGAMRSAFGGVHIALVRNPFTQFTSCKDLNFMKGVGEVCRVLCESFARIGKWYERNCSTTDEKHRDALKFAVCYVICNVTAMIHSDFVLDTDRVAIDESYRKEILNLILNTTGLEPDFTDCVSAGKTKELYREDYAVLNDAIISLIEFLRTTNPPGLSMLWSTHTMVMQPEAAISWIESKCMQSHATLWSENETSIH